jgi:hypothetical protein
MRRIIGAVVLATMALGGVGASQAAQPSAKTFVAVLRSGNEVPPCTAARRGAGGLFVAHVVNGTTGLVRWKVVANNLPGTITASHIHLAPKGVAGPIVQPLFTTPPGVEHGVIARGTFTNAAVVAGVRANPDGYYVNVHTTVCPGGAARGQLGDHGPLNR